MSEKATIIVKNQTRDLMKKIGRKDQTYDDLINELIRLKQQQDEIQN